MENLHQLIQVVEPVASFKKITFPEKFAEYQNLRCNHPGFVPIFIKLETTVTGQKDIVWFKMYVNQDIYVGHLRDFLRKMLQQRFINIQQYKDSIMLVVGEDVIVKFDISVKEIYEKKREKDGWLYIIIAFDHQK